MKRTCRAVLAIVLVALCGMIDVANDDDITVAAVPPVVVSTTPEAGTEDVDPATTEMQDDISGNDRQAALRRRPSHVRGIGEARTGTDLCDLAE